MKTTIYECLECQSTQTRKNTEPPRLITAYCPACKKQTQLIKCQ